MTCGAFAPLPVKRKLPPSGEILPRQVCARDCENAFSNRLRRDTDCSSLSWYAWHRSLCMDPSAIHSTSFSKAGAGRGEAAMKLGASASRLAAHALPAPRDILRLLPLRRIDAMCITHLR